VEELRRGFEALERALEAYWKNPHPIAVALEAGDLSAEWREFFDYLDPQLEWRTLFLGQTVHGHRGAARGWDDFLKWAEDYRPSLEEIEDIGGDQVLGVVTLVGQARDEGPRIEGRFFSLFTMRNGKLVRLEEYTTRDEAVEAAQLQG